MSQSEFMRNHIGKLVLVFDGAPPYPKPWPIKVYEIDEPDMVGVIYPDGSLQVHPRTWWTHKLRQAAKITEQEAAADEESRFTLKHRIRTALGVPRIGYPMVDGKNSAGDSPISEEPIITPPSGKRKLVKSRPEKKLTEDEQQARAESDYKAIVGVDHPAAKKPLVRSRAAPLVQEEPPKPERKPLVRRRDEPKETEDEHEIIARAAKRAGEDGNRKFFARLGVKYEPEAVEESKPLRRPLMRRK